MRLSISDVRVHPTKIVHVLACYLTGDHTICSSLYNECHKPNMRQAYLKKEKESMLVDVYNSDFESYTLQIKACVP